MEDVEVAGQADSYIDMVQIHMKVVEIAEQTDSYSGVVQVHMEVIEAMLLWYRSI